MHERLWNYAADTVEPEDFEEEKDEVALSKICLLVDSSLYVHVSQAKTAKEAWNSLKDLFEVKGSVGRLSHLCKSRRTPFGAMYQQEIWILYCGEGKPPSPNVEEQEVLVDELLV